MLDTDRHWKKWGRLDPYFAVLAHERFGAENIQDTHDEFLVTGRTFVADVLGRFELFFGAMPTGRALDHGCGVGRLSLPLSRFFPDVVAMDISPDMLAEARLNATRSGVDNVAFVLADDHLSNAPGQYDFVNSHMVLQHVPVRRGLPLLFRLIDKVRAGGGFHIHLSMRIDRWPLRLLYWASANIPGVKVWQNVCAGRPWNMPAMQMNNYPLHAILARLAAEGMTDLIVSAEPGPRFTSFSLIGRKPALHAPEG